MTLPAPVNKRQRAKLQVGDILEYTLHELRLVRIISIEYMSEFDETIYICTSIGTQGSPRPPTIARYSFDYELGPHKTMADWALSVMKGYYVPDNS